jgi:DNA processing protein
MDNRLKVEAKSDGNPPEVEFVFGSEGYPSRLGRLTDPPQKLFVQGEVPMGTMVAIVGSRNADSGARRFASNLARDLCDQNLIIVSGGALGIDTAAHEGALAANGKTVAVMGSGFDYMYPKENKELFSHIAATGAVISEFDREQPPTRWTFPRRNRVVSALASAVVVVQAGQRSGALITSRIAREYNVPVGAVPGVAGDPLTRGSNGLLRNGAALVEGVSDVLELVAQDRLESQLGLPGIVRGTEISRGDEVADLRTNCSPTEIKILDFLCTRPIHIDEITSSVGIEVAQISAAILTLEIAGLVEDRGGKNYVIVN